MACVKPLLPFGLLIPLFETPYPISWVPRRIHRVIDVWIKGVSLSVRKGDQGDAPLDVSPLPVGLNIPSSLRPYPSTSRLRYQREFVLHLFPTLLPLLSIFLSGTAGCWQRGRDPERGESRP